MRKIMITKDNGVGFLNSSVLMTSFGKCTKSRSNIEK